MPSYTPVTLPASEKASDRLAKIGLEGFSLIDKFYGSSGKQRRPDSERFGMVNMRDSAATSYATGRWGKSLLEADVERRANAEREAKEERAKAERISKELSQARAQLVAFVERRDRAEREVDEQRQARAKRDAEEERWAREETEAEVERWAKAEREANEERAKAERISKELTQARAQLVACEERRDRAEREVEEQRQARGKRDAEEERRARAETKSEEERWAREEREAEVERRAKAERDANVERAKAERISKELSQARAQLVACEERRDRAEREVEEQRQARAKRDAEEERMAREEREAEVERCARAEREAEKERRARADREAEEERHARAEREADEEIRVRAEREAEEERHARAERESEIVNGETLYKAICSNNWARAKAFLDENPCVLTTKVTSSGKTALHVAALFGHVSIVDELVKLVPSQFLETTDDFGNTPLLIATVTGITHVAECLVSKNTNILGIPNSTNELPITLAFLNGHQEMGRYLYSKTPLQYLHPENASLQGAMLLHCCLQTQCFDIALDLLNRCQELLFVSDKEGWKPIYAIATMNSTIPRRNELVFWKRLIFDSIDINSNPRLDHDRLPIQRKDTSERAQENRSGPGHRLLQWVIFSTYNRIGVKKIQELKLLLAQADKILDLVCANASRSDQVSVIADALFLAAKEGNVEFVLQISKANPDILLIGDSSCQNIFFYAVKNRQARVFNHIHGLRFKDIAATSKDIDGNTLLHVAATLAPAPFYNRIYGPTLQMQRELLWFKEVESLVPPTIRGARNKDGMSAEELFRESHRDLMKQGEKWVKATASSCSVVGTLIVTIMFAVAFTVPGGNDQTFGYPLFIKQPFFKIFLFSTILSLISSSTSVLMFLAIFTARYSEEKFLKSIPTKLMLGLSSLFISIVSMMIAFLSTIRLILKHTSYTWGVLPIIMLAIVPIFLFVLSQFPLLVHTAFSTYGNIFNRKVEKWP